MGGVLKGRMPPTTTAALLKNAQNDRRCYYQLYSYYVINTLYCNNAQTLISTS